MVDDDRERNENLSTLVSIVTTRAWRETYSMRELLYDSCDKSKPVR